MSLNSKAQQLEYRLQSLGNKNIFPEIGHCPIIGITGNFREGESTLAEGYFLSVIEAGGAPVIIPPFDKDNALIDILDRIDGVILTGGADIDPDFFNETKLDSVSVNPRRDMQELMLVRLAMNRNIPILGICRGIQVIAASMGGGLFQDIEEQYGKFTLQHNPNEDIKEPKHSIIFSEDSLLRNLFGKERIEVNSFHHQAVRSVPEGFKVTARATDGIIEGIESERFFPIIGVQWHPERMLLNDDRSMIPLFKWLVEQAILFSRAKQIHEKIVTLDSHCDTPMFFEKGARLFERDTKLKINYDYVGERSPNDSNSFFYNPLVDIHKMTEGRIDCCFMVAYLKQQERDQDNLISATARAEHLISLIKKRVNECGDSLSIAYYPDDIQKNKILGKKSIVLAIENGYALGLDIANVAHFKNMGVAYITLCHNGDNDICDSSRGKGEHNGLSKFGRKIVHEMNLKGVMIDLSHASEKSFYDTLSISLSPVICSHSSSKFLCNHPRNLTDNQLKALAHNNGVVQVCMYDKFLRENGGGTVKNAIEHILHMVDIMGIDHVGIGSDFDGGGGILGLENASWYINLTRELISAGLSDLDIEKIWGLNFLRVWKQVISGII